MKIFFQKNRVWDIIQTGFMKPTKGVKLSSSVVKELEKNRQLDGKAFHSLIIKV